MPRAISTDSGMEYQFIPVPRGKIKFLVQAAERVRIALTTEPRAGDHMYEVFIGGGDDKKSAIQKNRRDVAKPSGADILRAGDQLNFWIKWEDYTLSVGKEKEEKSFLKYTNNEPLAIGYFGIATGSDSPAEWRINDKIEAQTPYQFYPTFRGAVSCSVKAESDAHIILAEKADKTSNMYKVILGGWDNQYSTIRYIPNEPAESTQSSTKFDEDLVSTANLLDDREIKNFVITWNEGLIKVMKSGLKGQLIMEKKFPGPYLGISYVGVATPNSHGEWDLEPVFHPDDDKHRVDPTAPTEVGEFCWYDAVSGVVLAGAVEGGNDGEPLFMSRASHEGALLPGKVKPSHSVCYVAWGGQEHGKTEYQVRKAIANCQVKVSAKFPLPGYFTECKMIST